MKWITLQHFAADELSQLWANHGCDHGHTAGGLTSNSSSRVNQSEDEHRAKKLSLQATVFCHLRREAEPAVEVVWSWKSRRIAAAVVVVGSVVVQVVSVLLLLVVADEIWNLRTANGLTASSLRGCVRHHNETNTSDAAVTNDGLRMRGF